jgi:hypothetical protein
MKTEVVIIQCFSSYSASDPMTTYNTQVVVPQASCESGYNQTSNNMKATWDDLQQKTITVGRKGLKIPKD